MSEIPTELKYASSHEWVRLESDGSVVVGITDHAQDELGDVVFVELPEVGSALDAGAEVVIAAGGVVMAIVADQGVFATPSGAPIVNGVAALIQQAKAAVELRRLMGGVYTSNRLTYAKPDAQQVAGFRKAYGQRVYPGVD